MLDFVGGCDWAPSAGFPFSGDEEDCIADERGRRATVRECDGDAFKSEMRRDRCFHKAEATSAEGNCWVALRGCERVLTKPTVRLRRALWPMRKADAKFLVDLAPLIPDPPLASSATCQQTAG